MSRVEYSIKNAKVSLLFYLLLLVLNFFSRRVFIDYLGDDLVGLTGTVISYIGFLNLAEMGIAVAIANALYLPIFNNNKEEISDLISLFGYLFRWVGIFIGAAGVVFSFFIPLIFAGDGVSIPIVYAAFYTFLTTTLLSYLVNYKQNLLIASQKNYVVTRVLNLAMMAKILLQMTSLMWLGGGYVAWLALELAFGIVFSVWLGREVRREYPWLRTSLRRGKAVRKEYPGIFRNTKRVFSHKLAGIVLIQSDNIIISQILSLATVTFYGNYTMIIQRLTQIVTGTMTNSYAGVGNLVAEGDKSKIKLVFWQFNAMYFWIAGIACFGFYHLITPFIPIWLGNAEYILPQPVLVALVVTLFFAIIRQTVQYFVNAYGIFSDIWASWTEAGLNLAISIVAGLHYGLLGIVLGTAVSTGLMVLFWRPYFLYSRGFREGWGEYLATLLKFLVLLGMSWLAAGWLIGLGWLPDPGRIAGWLVNAVAVTAVFALIYGAALYVSSQGMKDLVRLWANILRGRLGRGRQKSD